MLDIQYSPVKLSSPPAVLSPTTIPKFEYMPGDPDLSGFKGRFFTTQETTPKILLSTISTSDIQNTGIDFMAELCNDDFDEAKMVKLVQEIEKENAHLMSPPLAETPKNLPVMIQ